MSLRSISNCAELVIFEKGDFNKNFDEIPFAQRSIPIRKFLQEKSSSLFFLILLICFSLLGTSLSFIFPNSFFKSTKNLLMSSSEDLSLLGHLPYKETSHDDLVELYPGLKVHVDMHSALLKMRDAAYLDGIELVFLSGFRSINLQKEIFYENKSLRNQIAIERAKVSAPPGYSEHSTGYAIDIGDRYRRESDFEGSFEFTPAFGWLKNNAAKFHFVLSFPRNNSQGVSYEPWHWRYEGTVDALKQFELANRKRSRS
tara:strand:+ start:1319 stop:2089 length:771 start_codon:yes stop_codon:yes gene_type:complete